MTDILPCPAATPPPPPPQESDRPTKILDKDVPAEYLIADLQRVAAKLPHVPVLTRDLYRAHGRHIEAAWTGRFGSWAYFLEAAGLEDKSAKRAKEPVQDEPAEPEESSENIDPSGILYKEKYVYNPATDTYFIFLTKAKKTVFFSGEQMRAIRFAYSNMTGSPASINEICRTFGIRRDWFNELKQAIGLTHDDVPFTNEEIMTRDPRELAEDVLQAKKQEFFKHKQKEEWKEIQANSNKWVSVEQSVLVPLTQHIEKFAPTYRPFQIYIKPSFDPFAVVLAPFDLHFGKYCAFDECGNSYSMAEARQMLIQHTLKLANRISNHGRPDKIILGLGSDYFHIDNENKTTTHGTPQDCDGSYYSILTQGCELAIEQIELLRQISPVEVLKVNGNHDFGSATALMLYVQAWFRECSDVTFNTSPQPRQYSLYGDTLLGFGHGDSVKPGDLAAVMAAEADALWKESNWRCFFSGHLHYEVEREIHGITHYQLSSLAGADRWHKKNGYITSKQALQAYLVSLDEGIITKHISSVKNPHTLSGVKVRKPN